MPFTRISLLAGKSPEYLAAISDSLDQALTEAFEVPETDRFAAIHQHQPGELIFDRYDAGDPVCQRLVAEFFNGLGHGLYNLVHIFDPQTIFIGGGVVERPGFLTLLRQHLAWFGIADYLDTVSHGNDAGLIGAVYHFNQLYRSPDDDRH